MKTITMLNKALADEYLAAIQYFVGAKAVKETRVKEELVQHAHDELKHAQWLCDSIEEQGGKPIKDIALWKKISKCGYTKPTGNTQAILRQNIKGEICAIDVYRKILAQEDVKEFPITHVYLRLILADEQEHLEDLEYLLKKGSV